MTVAISELTILKISNAIDFHSLLGLFVMITSGMDQFMNFAISFSSKDKLQNLGWTKSGRTFNVFQFIVVMLLCVGSQNRNLET